MKHAIKIPWNGPLRRFPLVGSLIASLCACADQSRAAHDDHTQDSCEQLDEELLAFSQAARCDSDADCHLFGSCSHAEWRVVAKRDLARASPIYDEIKDRCVMTADGPVPSAGCRDGMCGLVGYNFQEATAFCGQSSDAGRD